MRRTPRCAWLVLLLVAGSVAAHTQPEERSSGPTKHLVRKKEYLWKTGSWGSCYAPGGCGDGRRERPVWCSEPEGRTVLEFLCDSATKPERSRSCFTACRHHRDKLQWQVGQWGPCLPVYPSGGAAVGADVRAFSPLLVPTQDSSDVLPTSENPLEPQPIDEYLEAASSQGLESKESGVLGVMQRAVACVLVSHEARAMHRAVDDDNCFTVARKPDPVRLCRVPTPQDCIVSDFSDWSGTCAEACGNVNETRVRNVLVAPHNGGKSCPQLTESRPCSPRVECVKGRVEAVLGSEYKLKVGEWRRCEAPTSLVSADALYAAAPDKSSPPQHAWDVPGHENYTYQPQVGYQTREVSCRDSRAAIVDISLCLGGRGEGAVPGRVRPCVVAQDCVVSQWSPWSRTQDGCVAASGEVRPEVHARKRDVVALQQGDGQPCPHLIEERRVSERDQLQLCADKYRWLASRWSPCVVTQAEGGTRMQTVGCGGGVQLRSLSCVMRAGDRPVPAEQCASLEPLPTVQRCEVACPRDCEVGEWGPWGPCRPFDCPANAAEAPTEGYRQRERTVVVAASKRGLECPAVREVQPCPQPTCHSWSPGPWGPCELDPGVVRCGEGRRTRTVVCATLDGSSVNDNLCARHELKPPQDEPCLQPCPFDCVLSPWSAWSPCSHACSSPRQAALRQRNRTVVAPAGPGGHPCPDPDEMLQIEACNLHSCHGYSWLALPWQSCEVQNSTAVLAVLLQQASVEEEQEAEGGVPGLEDTAEPACGRGVQRREAWCMEANERKVHDWKCRPLSKPVTLRVCSAPCPQDCEVSPWSEWSSCPQECVPDESNEVRENGGAEVAPTQLRHRVALRLAAGGGATCPSLEELRPCPLSAARCRHHAWWSGEWSQCQLPANVECGQGYRTRAVACVLNGRARVDPSVCMQEGGVVPPMAQPCHVACDFPCVLSDWSTWTPCHQACGGAAMRRRSLIGLAASRAACRDPRRFPLAQSRSCPCSVFDSRPEGPWSACILEGDASEETANGRPTSTGLCGSGRRFRARACRDKAGNLVEPSRCGETGVEEEPCLLPCPADCTMGEWGTWGACSAACGPGLQTRQRKILRPALNGGRPCGSSLQTKVCETPCVQFTWAVGGWEDCRLIRADQQKGCGTGDQSRTVRCVHEPPHQPAREVSDRLCDATQQPEDETACHVTCPGECVVSPWSDWSVCAAPCHPAAERQRTRSVLRAPAAHLTVRCPPLIEVQSCVLNETCFTYEWRATQWSSCLPLGGSPCGEGVESRGVFCLRSDGRPVEDILCADQQRPSPGEKWCYVDCPVDCEVGEWTAWNSSECECGGSGSAMRRVRHISTNPSEMGRPCPIELIQHQPCSAVPCFSWQRDEWSQCDLHGASCGHGTVARNVTCRRELSSIAAEEGEQLPEAIDEDLCLSSTRHLPPFFRERAFLEVALDLRREDACYVPCRGDCEVAEWSEWGHCHRNCRDGEMGGYQTRSRAVLNPPRQGGEPCPTALYETRPCFSGPCLTFDWAVRDGVTVCQRSDGMPVTGGCDGRPRPCIIPCTADHAECTREGVCACASGFAARYEPQSRGRRLRACVPMSSAAAAAAPGAQAADAAGLPVSPEDAAEIQSRFYYPKDDDVSVWMFAMIGIGCVFIVFVAVSIYLMCHSSANAASRLQPQTLTVRQNPREGKP